jgi:hypothetical protein
MAVRSYVMWLAAAVVVGSGVAGWVAGHHPPAGPPGAVPAAQRGALAAEHGCVSPREWPVAGGPGEAAGVLLVSPGYDRIAYLTQRQWHGDDRGWIVEQLCTGHRVWLRPSGRSPTTGQ